MCVVKFSFMQREKKSNLCFLFSGTFSPLKCNDLKWAAVRTGTQRSLNISDSKCPKVKAQRLALILNKTSLLFLFLSELFSSSQAELINDLIRIAGMIDSNGSGFKYFLFTLLHSGPVCSDPLSLLSGIKTEPSSRTVQSRTPRRNPDPNPPNPELTKQQEDVQERHSHPESGPGKPDQREYGTGDPSGGSPRSLRVKDVTLCPHPRPRLFTRTGICTPHPHIRAPLQKDGPLGSEKTPHSACASLRTPPNPDGRAPSNI